jgi:hypothetical protein
VNRTANDNPKLIERSSALASTQADQGGVSRPRTRRKKDDGQPSLF